MIAIKNAHQDINVLRQETDVSAARSENNIMISIYHKHNLYKFKNKIYEDLYLDK